MLADLVRGPVAVAPERLDAIERFLRWEAFLLDHRRWQEWAGLFTPDGEYWAPLSHEQQDPYDHASLFFEDRIMRDVRIRRLDQQRAWSQQPLTRTARIVGNAMVTRDDDAALEVLSTFHVTEWRKGRDLRVVAGHYRHRLTETEDGFRIAAKRIDIISRDGVQDPFEIFL